MITTERKIKISYRITKTKGIPGWIYQLQYKGIIKTFATIWREFARLNAPRGEAKPNLGFEIKLKLDITRLLLSICIKRLNLRKFWYLSNWRWLRLNVVMKSTPRYEVFKLPEVVRFLMAVTNTCNTLELSNMRNKPPKYTYLTFRKHNATHRFKPNIHFSY